MRILANENFPLDAVVSLRAESHDVLWVHTESPGISDLEVLNQARRDDRVLVTFEKDFGELAFHFATPSDNWNIFFVRQRHRLHNSQGLSAVCSSPVMIGVAILPSLKTSVFG